MPPLNLRGGLFHPLPTLPPQGGGTNYNPLSLEGEGKGEGFIDNIPTNVSGIIKKIFTKNCVKGVFTRETKSIE